MGKRFTEFFNEHKRMQVFLALPPAIIAAVFIQFFDMGFTNRMRDLDMNDSVAKQYLNAGLMYSADKQDGGRLLVHGKNIKNLTIRKESHLCSAVCGGQYITKLNFDDLTSCSLINFDLLKNPDVGTMRYSFTINGRNYMFNSGEKMFDIYLDEPDGYKVVMGMEAFHVDTIFGIERKPWDDGRVRVTVDSSFLLDDSENTGIYFSGYTRVLPTDDIYVSDTLDIWKPVPKSYGIRFVLATGLPVFATIALLWGIVMYKCYKKKELEFMGTKDPAIANFGAAGALIILAVLTVINLK